MLWRLQVVAERCEVRLAFCWSHVRRRFYELASAGPAPIASEALIRIADLYRIDSEVRGRSAAERPRSGRSAADLLSRHSSSGCARNSPWSAK